MAAAVHESTLCATPQSKKPVVVITNTSTKVICFFKVIKNLQQCKVYAFF